MFKGICFFFCLKFLGVCSIGRVVRAIAESDPKANTENHKIKNAIAAGEMINKQSIQKILQTHIINLSGKKGIIIDGYPRDMKQVTDFEDKVIILIDHIIQAHFNYKKKTLHKQSSVCHTRKNVHSFIFYRSFHFFFSIIKNRR